LDIEVRRREEIETDLERVELDVHVEGKGRGDPVSSPLVLLREVHDEQRVQGVDDRVLVDIEDVEGQRETD